MDRLGRFRDAGWTLRNEDRSFTEWHNGRTYYYFWAILIEDVEWDAMVDRAARSFADVLVPGYQRQTHITLLPAGFQTDARLSIKAISGAVEAVDPFVIALDTLDSFTSSLFFGLAGEVALTGLLRRQLRDVMVDPDSVVADADYRPHVTVGLYRERYATASLANRIADFNEPDLKPVTINKISLARYETASIKGPITSVLDVSLINDESTLHHCPELFDD